MQAILAGHKLFYEKLDSGSPPDIKNGLKGIRILDGFIQNYELVKQFYQRYYGGDTQPKIVLCGINPGRNGAGKTGVPFLDFTSLSALLEGADQLEEEKSAQFMYGLINHFGAERFFRQVYLTNVSWYGFVKTVGRRPKNVNYYELPGRLPEFFTAGFSEEMAALGPKVIIPLSRRVEQTLQEMKRSRRLPYALGKPLPHPYYCSFNRPQEHLNLYIHAIHTYLRKVA